MESLALLQPRGIEHPVFIHSLFDDICKRGKSCSNYVEFAELKKKLTAFLVQAVGNGKQRKEIVDDLRKEGVEEKFAVDIANAIEARREETLIALRNGSSNIASNYLKDFDWSLRLILSSDSVSEMHEPVLLLNFETENAAGASRNKTWELSKSQLDNLLGNFQRIQEILDKTTD